MEKKLQIMEALQASMLKRLESLEILASTSDVEYEETPTSDAAMSDMAVKANILELTRRVEVLEGLALAEHVECHSVAAPLVPTEFSVEAYKKQFNLTWQEILANEPTVYERIKTDMKYRSAQPSADLDLETQSRLRILEAQLEVLSTFTSRAKKIEEIQLEIQSLKNNYSHGK